MKLFTIGFNKKSAEEFFGKLKDAKAKRLIDIRLSNSSQLAGFTKKDDLRYFAKAICNIDYLHQPELAPSEEIFTSFKKEKGDYRVFERQFLSLMKTRRIEKMFSPDLFDGACLLCSEETPDKCHRRLVAEYLKGHWKNLEIEHIP
jgi:uncharacterized protein (DUF488 family)